MGPTAGVSEDRVQNMINHTLEEYEIRYGEPRHRENTAKFDQIFSVLNQQKGSFTAVKVIGSIAAFLCMAILGLLTFLVTHHQQSMLSVQQPSTVAQTQFDARY